jgi:hypothetical protein
VYATRAPGGAWAAQVVPDAWVGDLGLALAVAPGGAVHLLHARDEMRHLFLEACP